MSLLLNLYCFTLFDQESRATDGGGDGFLFSVKFLLQMCECMCHRAVSSPLCVPVLQEKQSDMEGLKQQLVEEEKRREEHSDTIGKLRQVTSDCLFSPVGELYYMRGTEQTSTGFVVEMVRVKNCPSFLSHLQASSV